MLITASLGEQKENVYYFFISAQTQHLRPSFLHTSLLAGRNTANKPRDLLTMAPPNIDSNNTDIQILLITLSCCGELNLDSKVLAEAFGITRADNACVYVLAAIVNSLTKVQACAKSNRFLQNTTTNTKIGGSLELMMLMVLER
jgi:hypothetical protein